MRYNINKGNKWGENKNMSTWVEMSYNKYKREQDKELFNIDNCKYSRIHFYDFKEDDYGDEYNPALKEITRKEVRWLLEEY